MDKYLQYDIQDFAEEPSFVNWVRQANEADTAFWEAFREKHPAKATQIEQAKTLVELLSFEEESAPKSVEDKVWEGIAAKIKEPSAKVVPLKPRRNLMRYLVPAGVAAAIALLVFFNWPSNTGLSPNYDTQLLTELSMTKEHGLPDGSKVVLNADSKLDYDKGNWAASRRLKLEGEAFFEVEKGQSFIVDTPNGSVEVLGTSFNVYARAGVLKVVCETGKVVVKTKEDSTILTKGEAVQVQDGNHASKFLVEENNRSNWRNGLYTFKRASLNQVMQDVERVYDVQVEMDEALGMAQFSGSFKINELETALQEICWPMGLEYVVNGDRVIVKKK